MDAALQALLGAVISDDELRSTQARGVAKFVRDTPELNVALIEVRQNELGAECLILEVRLDLVQRLAHDIRPVEHVAASFGTQEGLPMVLPLRHDFPLAPHTNDTPPGIPVSMCLYREPWQEVRLSWTPGNFIRRIRWWLETTAEGGLYGGDNPVEPFFFQMPTDMIVERSLFERLFDPAFLSETLQVKALGGNLNLLLLESDADPDPHFRSREPAKTALIRLITPVVKDGRVRVAPQKLANLAEIFDEIGFEIIVEVRAQIRALMANAANHDKVLCLLVAAQVGNEQTQTPRKQLLAFLSVQPVAEFAVSLGEYAKAEKGYGRILDPPPISAAGADLDLMPVNIGIDVDQAELAALSGFNADTRKIVQVGAGSLGSALHDCLLRQGFGQWTLVDHDYLKPHNLARHVLGRGALGVNKAVVMAGRAISRGVRSSHIEANVLAPGEKEEVLQTALDNADLIIDATASAAAARALSANPAAAPRVSTFFLGDAKAIAVLIEGAGRHCRIDDLEAAFVASAIQDDRIARILAQAPTDLATPASCRAPTSRAPWNRVEAFAGLAAEAIRDHADKPAAAIIVHEWIEASATIESHTIPTPGFALFHTGAWAVRVSAVVLAELKQRRTDHSPRETGGALFGAVDQWNRTIQVVAHYSDLEDSVGTEASFQRGLAGFEDFITSVGKRTRGAIVYLGEWHSHPPGHSAAASTMDLAQLSSLTQLLKQEGRPAVSLIMSANDTNVLLGETL